MMTFANAKKGFQTLFVAEILMLLSDLAGEAPKFENWVIGFVIAVAALALAIVAFVLNIKGVKLCAKDQEKFQKAYRFAIWGIVISVLGIVLQAFTKQVPWLASIEVIVTILSDVCEMLLGFYIFEGALALLRIKGEESEAKKTQKLETMYFGAYAVSIVALGLASAFQQGNDIFVAIMAFVGIAAAIVLLVAQIRYYFFLKRMANLL